MLYRYEATTTDGQKESGTIEAANIDIAVSSLQRRNLIIISIKPAEKQPFWKRNVTFLERIKQRDIVILSRQLSTLFEAKVPVLDSFKILAAEMENPALKRVLNELVQEIQGGMSMSSAMARHPEVFSKFYVSMVKSGEQSGKLDETFSYLADYLERSYELASRAKSAFIYPIFVIVVFLLVMVLMMVFVVPKLTDIIEEMRQEIPFYTQVVIAISEFLRNFGVFILLVLAVGIFFAWRYSKTPKGKALVSRIQLSIPFFGTLYRKFYLSRITDNLETLLSSGIPAVRALEITSEVVGNKVYEDILLDSANSVKGGNSISDSFSRFDIIPSLVTRMVKIGEESGKLNYILKVLAKFYKQEVDNTVRNLVSLIEPVMIIVLGIAVGFLLLSILGPIYSMTTSI